MRSKIGRSRPHETNDPADMNLTINPAPEWTGLILDMGTPAWQQAASAPAGVTPNTMEGSWSQINE